MQTAHLLELAAGYMAAAAENVMKLDCPSGGHHQATCPRCQASIQLAKALAVADRSASGAAR